MDLDHLAGAVVVARWSGTDPAAAAALVADEHLAGVILMGDNIARDEAGLVRLDQVRAVSAAVQDAAARDGRPWPAVVSVDQEGGRVARIGAPVTELPPLMALGAAGEDLRTRAAARASGHELRSLGLTTVFAPDADVTIGPADPTIGSRSASDDPVLVGRTVTAALQGYDLAGITAVAKHFPGHGAVTTDSHVALPVQGASAQQLADRELPPFAAAVAAGVSAVMVAHLDVRAWDPGVPTSLSPHAYAVLRDDLGFDGVAVTDALDMAAVADRYDSAGAAGTAIAAGADLLLMPVDAGEARAGLVRAVGEGRLDEARLREAATRVGAMQLAQQRAAAEVPARPEDAGAYAAVSRATSAAAVTVVDGPCSGPLVGASVDVSGGTATDRARFADAARAAGLGTGSGTRVRLLGGGEPGSGDVVVALDAPHALGGSRAGTARVALFGRTPGAFAALVDVLTGAAPAPGHLPVAVQGLPPGAGCPR